MRRWRSSSQAAASAMFQSSRASKSSTVLAVVYGRMAWDDVSPTITSGCHNPSKGRFLHPTQNRNITLREAAILQGFPRRYRFNVDHGKEAIALMIGNALPPPFIAAHAGALKVGLRKASASAAWRTWARHAAVPMADRVTEEQRSRNMAAVRSSNTTPERAVRSILHGLGLRFRLHQRELPGTPDIVLVRHETVVFVHGCFWHSHDCKRGGVPSTRPDFWLPKLQRNHECDRASVASLRELGWRVLIVWECELREPKRLARRLARAFGI